MCQAGDFHLWVSAGYSHGKTTLLVVFFTSRREVNDSIIYLRYLLCHCAKGEWKCSVRSWLVANAVSHTFNLVVAESSESHHEDNKEPTIAYDSSFAKTLQKISSLEFVKSLPFDPVKYVVPVGLTVGILMTLILIFLCVLKCPVVRKRHQSNSNSE